MPVNGKKKSKLNLGLTSFFGQSNKSVKTRQNQEKTNIEFEDNDE